MKKNKKKAYAKIELLAIILLLSIAGIFITISIGKLIDSEHRKNFKESVKNVLRSAELYVGKYTWDEKCDLTYPIVFICDGNVCADGDSKLDIKGEIPKSGTIIMLDHKTVKASYLSDGKFYAEGTKQQLQVVSNCEDIDVRK